MNRLLKIIIFIILSLAPVLDESYVSGDEHSDLIRALSDPSVKVTQSMFWEMREAVSPAAARVFFENLAQDPRFILGFSPNFPQSNNTVKKCPLIAPIAFADLLKTALRNSDSNNNDTGLNLQQLVKLYMDLIPWEIPHEEKLAFLETLATLYIDDQRPKENSKLEICKYHLGFLVSD